MRILILLTFVSILSTTLHADILDNGIPNVDDDRLYAWYDGNDALGADGVAETPIWPNKQGDADRDITNGFAGSDDFELAPVEIANGNMALRYRDVVTWQDAGEWGDLVDNITVFVAATVNDPNAAYFFTGNQGGGGTEANANFDTTGVDVWSMKGEFREDTAPLVIEELQYHSFIYNDEGTGFHYINGELQAEVEIGPPNLSGFVLGGRQNGNQRASVDFGEVIIYDDVLNDADRQAVESYLNKKFFSGPQPIPGDFDGNGALEATDIDLLTAEVIAGTNESRFDLNDDDSVDQQDRSIWVEVLKFTYFGDSNLDGEFNSSDFVVVFNRGKYEDDEVGNSKWEDGDWNGDGEFDSSDFVKAFTGGGYEVGEREQVAAVPEPSSAGLVWIAGVAVLCLRRSGRFAKGV